MEVFHHGKTVESLNRFFDETDETERFGWMSQEVI